MTEKWKFKKKKKIKKNEIIKEKETYKLTPIFQTVNNKNLRYYKAIILLIKWKLIGGKRETKNHSVD